MRSKTGFGGPGRDRTDDLFHAMEARSQLRHRPTFWGHYRSGANDLIYSRRLRGYSQRAPILGSRIKFLPFLPQEFSAIIDRARHLHNFPKTI